MGLSVLHLSLLHKDGSTNPLGVNSGVDRVTFYPYFVVKDLFVFFCFLFVFLLFVFYFPNALGHPDNYIPADPMKTPPHIVPEWYFLPFYAILRSIPDKLGGVVAMVGAILINLALPIVNTSNIRSSFFRPFHKPIFWFFIANFLLLGWLGQMPVEDPYITIKDAFALLVFMIIFAGFVFFTPNVLGHSDNYIPANPLVTPAHIVPEWYLLPFYAILRSVPDKLGGVILMFSAIFILFVLPWLDTSKVRSAIFRPIYRQFFWILVIDVLMLGYVGAMPAEGVYLVLARVGTIYYFLHFIVVMPVVGYLEKTDPIPLSISEPVLSGGAEPSIARKTNDKV